jgi:hypothetical protein
MLDESPKLLFLHWTVTGNPDEIVQQAKEAIMQTSSYSASTTANGTRGGTPSSSGLDKRIYPFLFLSLF